MKIFLNMRSLVFSSIIAACMMVTGAQAALFGLFSPYIGASYSLLNTSAKTTNLLDEEFKSKRESGSAFGVHLGVESNMIVNLGVEAFYEQAVKSENQINIILNDVTKFKNPKTYGVKARAGMNFLLFNLYATAGVASSKYEIESTIPVIAKNTSSQTYLMGIAGAGIGFKLFSLGAYAEYNYRAPFKNEHLLKDDYSSRISSHIVQVGARYYFL